MKYNYQPDQVTVNYRQADEWRLGFTRQLQLTWIAIILHIYMQQINGSESLFSAEYQCQVAAVVGWVSKYSVDIKLEFWTEIESWRIRWPSTGR
jgi:hypothetical protein